ncbi:MAG: hypothetical protein E7148_00370 [Rikenellaceae bacterium]|nr:hypothetical protein [Rikenellaceae bacterium]
MKGIFKTSLAAIVAMFVTANVFAQDPKKEIVIVDPFTKSAGVASNIRDNVQGSVMTGLSNVDRFTVVDAKQSSRLQALFASKSIEEVITADNWKTESEAAYKELGATRLLKGNVELCYEHKKLGDDGKWVYYTDLNFTLTVYNINDGSQVGSQSYKYSELSTTSYADSFNDALKKATKDMVQFCNKHFKVESYVMSLGDADKKGVVKDLWISGGSNVGIQNNTIFKILVEKQIGPKTIRQSIGQVIAKEVTDEATRCEIMDKKGGEAIKVAFNANKKLYVELDRKRGDGLKGFGRAFGF